MTRCSRTRWVLFAFLAAHATSCGGELTAPDEEVVFVQVVLGARTEGAPSLQPGYVLAAGVADSGRYLTPESFAMFRVADGAPLAWRHRGLTGPVRFNPRSELGLEEGVPNFVLPNEATGTDSLGFRDLRHGAAYRLSVVARGRQIDGMVSVPDSFTVRAVVKEGVQHVAWPSVTGAGGYEVFIPRESATAPSFGTLQQDTLSRVGTVPPGTEVIVHALSPALFRYMTDRSVRRGGISAGYGVLGAYSSAAVTF